MILVEIYVPSVDRIYEFKLNEDIAVSVITDELCSVICQKEQCGVKGDKSDMLLFHKESKRILLPARSLFENNIRSGDRLVLI